MIFKTMPQILHQDTGRFDRRFSVGPACWDFFDLLWLHEGAVQLQIGVTNDRLKLTAPDGVLIFPKTPFHGKAEGDFANASITHFRYDHGHDAGFQISNIDDALHIHNLIRLSLTYARRGEPDAKRQRLLLSILDCFSGKTPNTESDNRVENAWQQARRKLDRVRGLGDVAAFAGLSESAFRASHRQQMKGAAGFFLRDMRLIETERLLATTGLNLREISKMVGYRHPESLSAAFSKSRGQTPGAYRKWCRRFA